MKDQQLPSFEKLAQLKNRRSELQCPYRPQLYPYWKEIMETRLRREIGLAPTHSTMYTARLWVTKRERVEVEEYDLRRHSIFSHRQSLWRSFGHRNAKKKRWYRL